MKQSPFAFPLVLITSILLGGWVGHAFPAKALCLQPIGNLFLNLLLTCIVPLVFFSVSAAIAKMNTQKKLARVFVSMTLVFGLTGLIAAGVALVGVLLFPPAQGLILPLQAMPASLTPTSPHFLDTLTNILSVTDFSMLWSHQHMLALMIFAILVGLASAGLSVEQRQSCLNLLKAGETLFMRVFSLIMTLAPLGFFCYFAVLVAELGPKIMENYLRVSLIYYGLAILYFLVAYTAYAYLAQGRTGVRVFWHHLFLPAVTSIATCSSAASIPANLLATKAMGVPAEICEAVIPLGTLLHKEGSVMGGMIKIAFLFGLFHLSFTGVSTLLIALGVAVLVGTVMGAIPSGGMLGELLILTAYGFPPSALLAIAAISIIIDPIATLLNVVGNSVSAMLIARVMRHEQSSSNKT